MRQALLETDSLSRGTRGIISPAALFWQRQFDRFVARMRSHAIPVRVRLWNGFEAVLGDEPRVTFTIPSVASLRKLIRPSLDRLGTAYVEGKLEVEGKLADILQVAVRLATYGAPRARRGPRMFRHTRDVDAEAIQYHYDVSNQFYSLWLDRNMVYSCAYFRSPQDSLDDAQMQKIDHILVKLRVKPGDRLLDIGCGWGALIIRAAQKYGAKAVGITLSRNQYDLARERIAAAGLADRCEVRQQDYRDLSGKFDRIASVGMFEHVGLRNLHDYFSKIRDLLEDGGTVMNHGITAGDPDSAESPLGASEYIERYVFPRGELPHISRTLYEMCAAGLEPVDVENLRRHYALTLTHWCERFEVNGQQLREIAGDKRWRIWRMYLAGCAYGFANEWMALHQILAVKGGSGGGALPLTRDYIYSGGKENGEPSPPSPFA
jgi:cyclopropane-fatty-acyl-phospholipid synthase